ncbi:putative Beta-1,3-galactosyltransferase sqv-2 [Corchorus olitorius]|uniref:Beta-1,3-galactosyltransferase sqv-2 n=1 Tax=Corchorus olitorius TaxID=93759 RepID=A0A1R3IST1_9ROSI|nr:putative Beta-1,3-galactosyltransferase sqv-2 [Corchorus olitorius]
MQLKVISTCSPGVDLAISISRETTISNLEMDLAAARAAQEFLLGGSPLAVKRRSCYIDATKLESSNAEANVAGNRFGRGCEILGGKEMLARFGEVALINPPTIDIVDIGHLILVGANMRPPRHMLPKAPWPALWVPPPGTRGIREAA